MAQGSNNKKELFSCAMKGESDKVIDMYRQDAGLHKARITRSGPTALHIAVADGKQHVVKQMLAAMSPDEEERKKALRTPGYRNSTALHVAAAMGNVRMCHIIASVEWMIVTLTARRLSSWPLSEAGNMLFFAFTASETLTSILLSSMVTVEGTMVTLSFTLQSMVTTLIIHLYEDLANWVNEEGCSPLHLLASKPCAFRSGSRLGWMETIIYHCIYVEELEAENPPQHSDSHDCPDNYTMVWDFFSLIKKPVAYVLCPSSKPAEADAENPGAGGSEGLMRIYRQKQNHRWSAQIVKQLLHYASFHEYEDDGRKPQDATFDASLVKPSSTNDKCTICCHKKHLNCAEDKQSPKKTTAETPLLVAAKNGVMEIVEKIVELFPAAVYDQNEDKKNMVLLAVEHNQLQVYQFLAEKNIYRESLFHQVDEEGNSALNLAATLRDDEHWLIPSEALQMQWELKWYRFVKKKTPPDFFGRYNGMNETPDAVFTRTHKDLEKRAAEWMNKTSESCSVVAVLIATVAFATAATVPGGVDQETGQPTLEGELQFQLFAISSLVALACSITALVMFLSILTSRFQARDFEKGLPGKLLVGLTSLFLSIAFMLVSFCGGHFYVLKDTLHYLALLIYLGTCLPVHLFVLAKFPLYFHLLRATFTQVPQRSYRPAA